MESSNKSELHIPSGKEGMPGHFWEPPKDACFKSSQESCLSLKFKWIALGHKLSRGEGGNLAHLYTKLTHPTRQLHEGEKKKLKVKLMGKATDSFFSVSQVAPHLLLSPSRPLRPHPLELLLQCQQNWGWECGRLMKISLLNGILTWKEQPLSTDIHIYHYEPNLSWKWTNCQVIGALLSALCPSWMVLRHEDLPLNSDN